LEATQTIRSRLPRILDEIHAGTLLDIGCGDFTWMKDVRLNQAYIGADIVDRVIAENQRFATERRRFCRLDAIHEPLPEADAVLCRETLFHLSLIDGKRLLANLFSKPRKWLFCMTDTITAFNSDIHTGDFRPLNLRRAPFRFPAPDRIIEDSAVNSGRWMGMWDVRRLPRFT
jgi:hypothetical protein